MIGPGHPDTNLNQGVAPLPGTDHRKRLMATGATRALAPTDDNGRDACRLVKAEWDKIETWLTQRALGQN